jgi:glycosyltransferase involved in cell wall biosynthesis
MATIERVKVVWICHFTNEHIQDKLKVLKRFNEIAPWITVGIENVKKRNDIDLHIISPHRWIKGNIEFKEDNINYHFFNSGIPFYGRPWPFFFRFDIYSDFVFNKKKVKNFIDEIEPDIIHLHGLENHYYSSTVFQFINRYPIFATIQGFISLNLPKKLSTDMPKRVKVEKKLLKRLENFGVRTNAMKEEVLKYNKDANLFWHEYFLNIPDEIKVVPENQKKYDLIFFARVSKAKGVEDLIKATGILKKQLPKIKVAIVGGAKESYIAKLNKLAKTHNCIDNIDFLGFLPEQEDVFKILIKSKICVLPTYNDIIPGTLIESMFRKISVVSYRTGGIPDINEKDESVLLSEQGDIDSLVKNISLLLTNKNKRLELAEKAYNYATKRWDNEKSLNDIIKIYHQIIDNES